MKRINTLQRSLAKYLSVLLLFLTVGCEDFIQIDPPKNELISATVFTNDATANSAMRGIYSFIASSGSPFSGFSQCIATAAGLQSDELFTRSSSSTFQQLYNNSLETNHSAVGGIWNGIYQIIYYTNSVLDGLSKSSSVSEDLRAQLSGEAKFIRAFCYFYLVNLWSDVPLVLTTDYRESIAIERIQSSLVYDQILADLKDSEILLSDDYAIGGGERVRANRWTATAMLARVYLFLEDWANAEMKATEVISNTGTYKLCSDLNEVFLKNNTEAILQLFPTTSDIDTWEGQLFNPFPSESSVTALPLKSETASAFDSLDARLVNWVKSKVVNGVTYYYPYKYKIKDSGDTKIEYSVILRLGEQFLIRAEARTRQGKIIGTNSAELDVNTIRSRAGLTATTATTQDEMLRAIEQERKFELLSEWGHRWFDLKRTDKANTVLGPIKSDWQPTDMLWPIPQMEMNLNHLLQQNPGY